MPIPLKILIVEDNPDAGVMLQRLLAFYGHNVCLAFDGRRGLEIARIHKPVLIISDIEMPELDGYELAKEIRRDPELKDACLIAVTGFCQSEYEERAREAGFNVFMTKPIPWEPLRMFVNNYTADQQACGGFRRIE